jgi:3-hydroxybutyryl-CoA dehydrogenase
VNIRNVVVVGAGTMGSGIAQVFAQYGYKVVLHDREAAVLERALEQIDRSLGKLTEAGKVEPGSRESTLVRLTTTTDLGAAASAELAVEAVPEDLALKTQVFRELDKIAPASAILATNTSSISITRIATATRRAEKVIGMHFMNPVPLMPLVEVIRGQATSDQTAKTVMELSRGLGKTPVEAQDFPGFIANRVLMPMINEAAFAVHEGVASAEDVDQVMKLGMSHPMGPLALADFIGLDVCLAILEVMQQGLGDKYRPCPLLRRLVDAGWLGRKVGRGFYTYS